MASKRRDINEWARLGRQRWSKDAEAEEGFSENGVCLAGLEKNRVTEPRVTQLQGVPFTLCYMIKFY